MSQPRRGPRASFETQVVRALRLLVAMCSSRRGVHIVSWAQANGFNWRAVYRDLRDLEGVGIPIVKERARYRVPPEWMEGRRPWSKLRC